MSEPDYGRDRGSIGPDQPKKQPVLEELSVLLSTALESCRAARSDIECMIARVFGEPQEGESGPGPLSVPAASPIARMRQALDALNAETEKLHACSKRLNELA